tara:strand:- start:1623 stop:1766 length:144 start_codon:yes stop_codon:yes gene_type:complete
MDNKKPYLHWNELKLGKVLMDKLVKHGLSQKTRDEVVSKIDSEMNKF